MTMPHLMNCGHSDEGWCLDCVKAMHDEFSKKPHDGGPAFPMPSGPEPRVDAATHFNEGMALRDYFAAKAMQGMTVTLNAEAVRAVKQCDCSFSEAVLAVYEVFARRAYAIADAMLAERAKGGAA